MKQIHQVRVRLRLRLRLVRRAAWLRLKAWILGGELDRTGDCPLCPHPLSGHDYVGCNLDRENCHCPVAVNLPGQAPYLFHPVTGEQAIAWAAFQDERRRRVTRALRALTAAARALIPVARRTAEAFEDAAEAMRAFRRRREPKEWPLGQTVITTDNFAGGNPRRRIPRSRLGQILQSIRLAWKIWRECRRNDAARVDRAAGPPPMWPGDRPAHRSAIRRAWQILGVIRKSWAEEARGWCPVRFRTSFSQLLQCRKPPGHDGECWTGERTQNAPMDINGRRLSMISCPKCSGRGDTPETRRMARSFGQVIARGDVGGEWQDVLEIEERGGGWWWMRRRCRMCRGWGTIWSRMEVKGVPYR